MLPFNKVLSSDAVARIIENMPLSEVTVGFPNMHRLMELIQEKERPIRQELERLATSIVYNNFPIFLNNKSNVKVKAKLVDYILPPDVEGKTKAIKPDPELMDEYRKRKLINMITQGAGISTHGIHHLDDAFKQQNSKLVAAYDAFDQHNRNNMRTAPDAAFLKMSEEDAETARILGMVRVDHSNGRWVIHAEAVLMPVLIHEIIKGMYELIAIQGLPKDKATRANVLEFTDTKRNEFIDCKYGETIYPLIRDAIRNNFHHITDDRPEVQEYYLQSLYEKEPREMIREVEDMIMGRMDVKKARAIMDGIYRDMKRDDYEASIK